MSQYRITVKHPTIPRLEQEFTVEAGSAAEAQAQAEAAGWIVLNVAESSVPDPIASLGGAAKRVDSESIRSGVAASQRRAAAGASASRTQSSVTPPPLSGSKVPAAGNQADNPAANDPVVSILSQILKAIENQNRQGKDPKSEPEKNALLALFDRFLGGSRIGRGVGDILDIAGQTGAARKGVAALGARLGMSGTRAAGVAAGMVARGGATAVGATVGSAGGPVGLAIGAAVGMAADHVVGAMSKAAKAAYDFGYEVEGVNRRFANVSGAQASIWASLDVQRTMRDMQRGNDTSGSAAGLADSLNKLETKLAPFETAIQDIKNQVGSVVVDLLSTGVDVLSGVLKILNETIGAAVGAKVVIGGREGDQASVNFLTETYRRLKEQQEIADRRIQAARAANRPRI